MKEINEVKNRENEYLAHIRALYPDKCISNKTDIDEVTECLRSKPVNGFNEGPRNEYVNRQEPNKVNTSLSAKNINSPGPTSPNTVKFPHTVPVPISYKNRIFQASNKKGIMHQFYTSRGKIGKDQRNANSLVSSMPFLIYLSLVISLT